MKAMYRDLPGTHGRFIPVCDNVTVVSDKVEIPQKIILLKIALLRREHTYFSIFTPDP